MLCLFENFMLVKKVPRSLIPCTIYYCLIRRFYSKPLDKKRYSHVSHITFPIVYAKEIKLSRIENPAKRSYLKKKSDISVLWQDIRHLRSLAGQFLFVLVKERVQAKQSYIWWNICYYVHFTFGVKKEKKKEAKRRQNKFILKERVVTRQ